jgi:hypothetical protein
MALACAVLLAGCSGSGGSGDDATVSGSATRPATETPAAETPATELSTGLLDADAFGPDAMVVAVPVDQLRAGAGLAAMGEDLQITPASCASAVQGTQPDLDAYEDVAGVSATSASTVTVEMLLRGGPTAGAVELMAGAAEACPQATVTSPQLGKVTVVFEDLPVPELGDASAAMRYTTSVTAPDGARTTVPAMVGAVEDGDRLMVLVSLAKPSAGSEPAMDPAGFADLLEQAHAVQADALG